MQNLPKTYTVADVAGLVGKSTNLLYRRLTEKPQRYTAKFARKEGERWVFDRGLVDSAIARGESLITRATSHTLVDTTAAAAYFSGESRSRRM